MKAHALGKHLRASLHIYKYEGCAVLNKVNLGLIGLGNMGKIHLRNCLHLKNARLVAVSDVSQKLLLTAKKAGVKRLFKDYDEMLRDPSVDAVIVSLPTFLHSEASIRAAEHGKHVLVEKPLARNASEAEQIVSAAKANGVRLMIGYPLRFSPSFVSLKNAIETGKIGDVQIAIANHVSTGPFSSRTENARPKPVPSWWFDQKLTGGGALIDLGTHMINLLRWYSGNVTSIQAYLGHKFNMDFEDHATCVLGFEKGTRAILNVGWFARYHRVQVDLYGTVEHASAASKSPSLFDYAKNLLAFDTSTGFYKELEYFTNCLTSGVNPSPSGEDGITDLKIISSAYKNTLRQDPTQGDYQ
jgi:myo-inositol 2-dehydrogenase/D-chiro-inositol 1-dehydrogenase